MNVNIMSAKPTIPYIEKKENGSIFLTFGGQGLGGVQNKLPVKLFEIRTVIKSYKNKIT